MSIRQSIQPANAQPENYTNSVCSAVVEQVAEMLFLHDLQGKILKVNNAAVKETGYSEEELLTMHVFDIDPDTNTRNDKDHIWNSDSFKDKITLEVKHQRKDGSIYDAEVTIGNIYIKGNRNILALARNVTEKKNAQRQLIQNEKYLSQIFNAIPDIIFALDKSGIFTDYKAAGFHLYYPDTEDFIGKSISDVLPAAIAEKSIELLKNAINTSTVQQFEYELTGRAGESGYFECRFIPLENDKAIAFVRNITQRKELEKQLILSETNARAIMESTDEVLVLLDEEGVVIDSNEAHAKRLGLTRKELLGKNVFTF